MTTKGDFSFIKNSKGEEDIPTTSMLKNMFNAISVTETWENLKEFVPGDGGFMFCEKPEWLMRMHTALGDSDGHSGSSYGWTIRCMDYIAKHGWDNFVLKMSNPDAETRKKLRISELPYSIQEAENQVKSWVKRRNTPGKGSPDVERQRQMNISNEILDALAKVNKLKDEQKSYLNASTLV
jgi:hypothetical protein